MAGGLLVRPTLKVTKNDGRPKPIGQPVNLLVENAPNFVVAGGIALRPQSGRLPLDPTVAGGRRSGG